MQSQSMVDAAAEAREAAVVARHRPRPLGVRRIVHETVDAVSFVLDVPPDQAEAFRYRAGQFVTVRVVIDGEDHLRSYSMSSAPDLDDDLRVTIKRVPGGLVSNWLHDRIRPGDHVEVAPPAGTFVVDALEADDTIVAFAAGSGITPIFSIVKHALTRSERTIALCYANRDRASTIFADALDELARRHPGRFDVDHHLDAERGFITVDGVAAFARDRPGSHFYVCGPTGFMETVETALDSIGVDDHHLHLERFTPAPPPTDVPRDGGEQDDADGRPPCEVTVRVAGRTVTTTHRPGTTLLQTARSAGLRAPSSCETGSCATCMARVVEGRVDMRHNDALTPDEVDEGWVLTCQSVPVSPAVSIIYE